MQQRDATPASGGRIEEPDWRLRLYVEQLPALAWATDTEMRIVWTLGAGSEALRLSGAAPVGATVPTLARQLDVNADAVEAHRSALRGRSSRYEISWGGSAFEAHVHPLRDDAGEVTGAVAIALDVTSRKRAEEELQRKERQLADAQAVAHVGSWEWDIASGRVTWSEELFRMLGLDPGECQSTRERFLRLVHPDDRERQRARGEAAIAGREGYGEDEYRIVRRDGVERVMHSRGIVLRDDQGKPTRIVGATIDVTERKRAEAELARRLRQQAAVAELGMRALAGVELQALLDHAVAVVAEGLGVECCKVMEFLPDGTVVMRAGVGWRHGLVGRVVPGDVASVCGYEVHADGPVVVEDFATDGRFPASPLVAEHGLVSGLSVLLAGRERPFGVIGAYDRSRRSYTQDDLNFIQSVASVLALTVEQHRSAEGLREHRARLRALSARLQRVREEEKSRVARDLHDDLGQLLTGLKMELRSIERHLGEGELSQAAGGVLDEVVAASELVDRTSETVRRIAADLRPVTLDHLGLGPALGEESRTFQERTGIATEVRIDEGFPMLQREAATALYRIAQEALTNVARHADAARVDMSLQADASVVALRVADDGRGVPAGGAGPLSLGILGMKERAAIFGGDVTVRPGEVGGTVVRAALPRTSVVCVGGTPCL
ncbi:MAG TPA: PAS domain-containing protein [Anaeromyxobacteraceae bacterium]|nr:PAS domain-containing protein [Anaeromyxobacteraceae bacterium]